MKSEKEITMGLQNKINIINSSIDDIVGELYNIQLYKNMLNDFTLKHSNELSNELTNEFKNIINKIDSSIEIINSKSYLLEINKLTKIIKTNSGNFIESTVAIPPIMNKSLYLKNNIEFNNDEKNNIEFNNDEKNNIEFNNDEKNNYMGDKKFNIYNYEEYEWTNNKEYINSLNINLHTLNFNVNDYENKKILSYIVYEIFMINIDFKKINISSDNMKKFIFQVSLHYYNNPYHNFKHAVTVLQFIHLIINKIEIRKYFSDFEIFGLLVAALVHDIGHPGHTNLFEINNKSHLALKYNDKSVLENHHCSLTFYIIHSKEINLFKNLNQHNFSIVRNMIIECVLSTDMKYHDELLKNLENKFFTGCECKTQHDRLLLGKILIHIADLSNQVRPFNISYQGSIALRNEFSNQIEKEEKLNLPIQEFMKLTSDKSFYSSEYYFSSNIVKPMWNLLVEIFPELNEYYNNLNLNIDKWKELLDNA